MLRPFHLRWFGLPLLSSIFVFGDVYVFVLHTLIWFDVVSLFPVQFPAASIVDARGCLNSFLPASFPPTCFFTWVLLVCRHPGFFYPIWEQQAAISSFLSWLFFNSFFINSLLTLSLHSPSLFAGKRKMFVALLWWWTLLASTWMWGVLFGP